MNVHERSDSDIRIWPVIRKLSRSSDTSRFRELGHYWFRWGTSGTHMTHNTWGWFINDIDTHTHTHKHNTHTHTKTRHTHINDIVNIQRQSINPCVFPTKMDLSPALLPPYHKGETRLHLHEFGYWNITTNIGVKYSHAIMAQLCKAWPIYYVCFCLHRASREKTYEITRDKVRVGRASQPGHKGNPSPVVTWQMLFLQTLWTGSGRCVWVLWTFSMRFGSCQSSCWFLNSDLHPFDAIFC